MAYSTIPKGSLYMNTKLYTGNGSTNNITGVGFQPDWVWIKNRGSANHYLFDVVRGVQKNIHSNENYAEVTEATTLTAFGSDGFTLSTDADLNGNGASVVSWNWKAGTGQGSSNTDGSINTTYTSVNTTAGFSISSYTGSGANATIGHGLGVTPNVVLVKCLSSTGNWKMHHTSLAPITSLNLNDTSAQISTASVFNSMATLNSSVFSVGTEGDTNSNGLTYVAYCFADVQGFSKMGSYVGNGNVDGTFVYTGFKPAFVMVKNTSVSQDWYMLDNKRDISNVCDSYVTANNSTAEGTYTLADFLSNGFKLRDTGGASNASGNTFIYMAFAENPFVATSGTTAVPVTAR